MSHVVLHTHDDDGRVRGKILPVLGHKVENDFSPPVGLIHTHTQMLK
jgi:hypothetical protein